MSLFCQTQSVGVKQHEKRANGGLGLRRRNGIRRSPTDSVDQSDASTAIESLKLDNSENGAVSDDATITMVCSTELDLDAKSYSLLCCSVISFCRMRVVVNEFCRAI